MAKEYRLSAERLEELKQELTYLKTVREKEVAELIKEARSFGDGPLLRRPVGKQRV